MRVAVANLASQPIRNMFTIDRRVASSCTIAWQASQSWAPGSGLVLTPTALNNDSNANFDSDQGAVRFGMTPGRKYTVIAYVHLDAAQVSTNLRDRARTICVWVGGVEKRSAQAPNAPGTTRLTYTFVASSAQTGTFIRLYNGSDNVNDVVSWGGISLVEGDDPGMHLDGSIPEWRWFGTAGNSESAGYPYTLENIAGPLLFDYSSAGTYTLNPSDYSVSSKGIALLAVTDLLAYPPDATVSTIAQYGPSADTTPPGNIIHRYIGAVINTTVSTAVLQARWTGGAGISSSALPGPRRYVSVTGLTRGLTPFVGWSGSTSFATQTTAFTAVNHSRVQVYANTSYHTTMRVLGIAADDSATILRAMAWLARKYGAAIPTGY